MTPIQVVLVLAAAFWVLRYLGRLRARGIERLLGVLAALAGVVLVLRPEWSQSLANLLGVTRGVDLLFYLGFVAVGYLLLHQAAKIRELETRLTKAVRSFALHEGERDASGSPERQGSAGADESSELS